MSTLHVRALLHDAARSPQSNSGIQPESLRNTFQALGIDATTNVPQIVKLTAILETPRGEVTLS